MVLPIGLQEVEGGSRKKHLFLPACFGFPSVSPGGIVYPVATVMATCSWVLTGPALSGLFRDSSTTWEV